LITPLVFSNVYSVNPKSRLLVYVLSLNNSKFGDYVDRIYLQELEIKDIPDTDRFVLYLDLHVDIDSEGPLVFSNVYSVNPKSRL
jgi:hypothetical protein